MFKRKKLMLLCTTVLCIALLVGCGKKGGSGLKLPFGGGVNSAEELFEKNKERKLKSYHLNGEMDMKMDVGSTEDSQISMSIPYKLSIDGDMYDKNVHMNITVNASVFGINTDIDQEMYVDGKEGKVYQKGTDNEKWTVKDSSDDDTASSLQDVSSVPKSLIEDAEFEKTDKGYKVTIEAKRLKEFPMFDELTNNENSENSAVDISKGTIEYIFNDDCDLTKVVFDNVEMKTSSDVMDQNIDMKIGVDATFKLSKHNKIKEEDVAAPDDIAKNATPTDGDLDLGLGALGGSGDSNTDDTDLGGTDDTGAEIQTTETPNDITSTIDDKFGSINGTPLTTGPNNFEGTFGAAGFEFNTKEDGQYQFSVCESPQYEDVTLYVSQKGASEVNCTKEKIESEGFYGYEINAEFAKNRPNMTWNGLTWGASGDDIIAAYGKADDTYDCEMYTSYTYKMSKNIEMIFYAYKEGQNAPGLQHVTLYVFEDAE